MKKYWMLVPLLALGLVFAGCGAEDAEETVSETSATEVSAEEESAVLPELENAAAEKKNVTIAIDPGHSSVVTGDMEPLGPGASEMKAADTTGTQGISTGVPEYALTLEVSQKLASELQARGYNTVLTRETNDVPLSCVARAQIATDAGADALVRIHANGSEDASVQGAMTICITENNAFHPELYSQARALSDCIITALAASTGCRSEGVWETDSMSGNNWSTIPATIVEMGYMSNIEEDERMQTDDYQAKIVQGIANGIDAYFAA